MNKKIITGMCIIILLIISTVSAVRTSGTVKEDSSISRLVGDSPYDLINQLDTKQIDIHHATHLASRLPFLEDFTSNKMIVAGFDEDNYNIKGDIPEGSRWSYLKFWDKPKKWTGGYDSITNEINKFQPNELFVLESYMDSDDFGIYAKKITKSDKIYPENVKEWKDKFAETNPLFLMNIEMGGLALPHEPSYVSELTRYSTIVAPKDVRSSEFMTALLCNLDQQERIGDIYRRSRSKYYTTTDPDDQNMPGLVLKSYSLYGNPLTRVNVPDAYSEYIKKGHGWWDLDEWFNPCKEYYVSPADYNYQGFSIQSDENLKFENTLNFDYNIANVRNSNTSNKTFRLINSTDFSYDYDNPNIINIYTIRKHKLPKGSIVKNIEYSLSDSTPINLDDYPSMADGNFTDRNCYDSFENSTVIKEIYERDNYDEVVVYLYPLRIDDCDQGNFTLFNTTSYSIEYMPSSPFYFDNITIDKIVPPNKELPLYFDFEYVSEETVNGTLTLTRNQEIVYQKDIKEELDNYEITITTPQKEGNYNYKIEYNVSKKEDNNPNVTLTEATFSMEVKVLEAQILVGDYNNNQVTTQLHLSNHLDQNLLVNITAETVENGEFYKQETTLNPGENTIEFVVDNLLKQTQNYELVVYVEYLNQRKILSDIIVTNHKPFITAENIYARVGDTIDLNISATDLDNDQVDINIDGAQDSPWVASEDDIGEHNITITASDGIATVERKIKVYIIKGNFKPELESVQNITITEEDVASLLLYAEDIDGDNLTYNVSNSNFNKIGDNWFEWITQIGDAGEYNITVSASDSELNDSKIITLTVLKQIIAIIKQVNFTNNITEQTPLDISVTFSNYYDQPLNTSIKLQLLDNQELIGNYSTSQVQVPAATTNYDSEWFEEDSAQSYSCTPTSNNMIVDCDKASDNDWNTSAYTASYPGPGCTAYYYIYENYTMPQDSTEINWTIKTSDQLTFSCSLPEVNTSESTLQLRTKLLAWNDQGCMMTFGMFENFVECPTEYMSNDEWIKAEGGFTMVTDGRNTPKRYYEGKLLWAISSDSEQETIPGEHQFNITWPLDISADSYSIKVIADYEHDNDTELHDLTIFPQTMPDPPACDPDWTCGNWSDCTNSSQTRTCTDLNECLTDEGKPEEQKECNTNQEPVVQVQQQHLVNEGELVTITVNATDPENDTLSYYINDSRFEKNENTFTWKATLSELFETTNFGSLSLDYGAMGNTLPSTCLTDFSTMSNEPTTSDCTPDSGYDWCSEATFEHDECTAEARTKMQGSTFNLPARICTVNNEPSVCIIGPLTTTVRMDRGDNLFLVKDCWDNCNQKLNCLVEGSGDGMKCREDDCVKYDAEEISNGEITLFEPPTSFTNYLFFAYDKNYGVDDCTSCLQQGYGSTDMRTKYSVRCIRNEDCGEGNICDARGDWTTWECREDPCNNIECGSNSKCDSYSEECSCEPGFANCDGNWNNGCEVNIEYDTNNCGSCGSTCSDSINQFCNQGQCESCPTNHQNCNWETNIFDACEADLHNDVNNCGTCGTVCGFTNSNAMCSLGTCSIDACALGFRDCNDNLVDGCEINSQHDLNNCGACGNKCEEHCQGTTKYYNPRCTIGDCEYDIERKSLDCVNDPWELADKIFDVLVGVDDGQNLVTRKITIGIININNVPTMVILGDTEVNEGEIVNITVDSADADGDNLTYSINDTISIKEYLHDKFDSIDSNKWEIELTGTYAKIIPDSGYLSFQGAEKGETRTITSKIPSDYFKVQMRSFQEFRFINDSFFLYLYDKNGNGLEIGRCQGDPFANNCSVEVNRKDHTATFIKQGEDPVIVDISQLSGPDYYPAMVAIMTGNSKEPNGVYVTSVVMIKEIYFANKEYTRFKQDNNTFTWQTNSSDIGEYDFEVKVSDGEKVNNMVVHVSVNGTSEAPVLEHINDINTHAGEIVRVEANAQDPFDRPLTYSINDSIDVEEELYDTFNYPFVIDDQLWRTEITGTGNTFYHHNGFIYFWANATNNTDGRIMLISKNPYDYWKAEVGNIVGREFSEFYVFVYDSNGDYLQLGKCEFSTMGKTCSVGINRDKNIAIFFKENDYLAKETFDLGNLVPPYYPAVGMIVKPNRHRSFFTLHGVHVGTIDFGKFYQNNNVFTWQTDESEVGEYDFNLNVSNGLFEDWQKFKVNVHEPCDPDWTSTYTNWNECLLNNTKYRTKYYYDANNCYYENPHDNETESTECDYCVPEWTNITGQCKTNNAQRVDYYYTNQCCTETQLPTDCNIPQNTTEVCDYCTPSLTNTSWSEWSNHTECLTNDTQQQIRTLTQYDENTCNEVDNTTFTDYQTIICDYESLHAPIINSIDYQTEYNETDEITITVYASDSDNDKLNYSINDSRFEQNNNIFTWLTNYEDAREYQFKLIVNDGEFEDTQIINILVNNLAFCGNDICDEPDENYTTCSLDCNIELSTFTDGTTSKVLTYNEAGNNTVYFKMPKYSLTVNSSFALRKDPDYVTESFVTQGDTCSSASEKTFGASWPVSVGMAWHKIFANENGMGLFIGNNMEGCDTNYDIELYDSCSASEPIGESHNSGTEQEKIEFEAREGVLYYYLKTYIPVGDDACGYRIDSSLDRCDQDEDLYDGDYFDICKADDCDDTDRNINPNAGEVCNNKDDDCDGSTDEGVQSTFYRDADADSYGDSSTTKQACSAPSGYVSNNQDCNDNNANINPGATEICNGIDDNCDGSVDGGCECINGETEVCGIDVGECQTGTKTCTDGQWGTCEGLVGPEEEVCDGLDNDCDGEEDENVQSTFYRDADEDTYGDSSTTTQACNAPAGYVSNNLDCNDANTNVNPAATEICNSINDDCDNQIDEGCPIYYDFSVYLENKKIKDISIFDNQEVLEFNNELNSLLESCEADENKYCLIPLTIESQEATELEIFNLSIKHIPNPCAPNWTINYTQWTDCQPGDTKSRIQFHYDSNTCEEPNPYDNVTEVEQCDFCTPQLTNTSWTEWINDTDCLSDDTQEQSRTLTQYDENNCDEVDNTTITDYQIISCDFCTPDWRLNQTWTECDPIDIQYRNVYDLNMCEEEFISSLLWDYQEQEIGYSDNCDQACDNDWSTYDNMVQEEPYEYFFNYSIPFNTEDAKVQYKIHFDSDVMDQEHFTNASIPSGCLNSSILQLRFFVDYTDPLIIIDEEYVEFEAQCFNYNSGGWQNLFERFLALARGLDSSAKLYESGVWWEKQISSPIINQSCDYCTPQLTNTSWSEWINNTDCLANDTQQQARTLTQYDENTCNEVDNTTFTDHQTIFCDFCTPDWRIDHTEWTDCQSDDTKSRIQYHYDLNTCEEPNPHDNVTEIEQCDYCTPNWIKHETDCSTLDNYIEYYLDENTCHAQTNLASDLENQTNNQTIECNYCNSTWRNENSTCHPDDYYDVTYEYINLCCEQTSLLSDCNKPEDTTAWCDYCTPSLINTSWSEWINGTECLADDTQEQTRTLTQYDENTCNEVDNATFTDYRTISCDYCTPLLTNTSWTEWSNHTECQPNDTQEQVRSLTQYDENTCNEVDNTTFTDYQTIFCDFCTPDWQIDHTEWTDCQSDDTKSRIQFHYDLNTCEEPNPHDNVTEMEQCDYCIPDPIQHNTSCLTSNEIIGYYTDNNNCHETTNLESDQLPENNTYECDYESLHAPTINSINYQEEYNEGDEIIITVEASDPDEDDLNYSINDDRFQSHSSTFIWQTNYDDAGEYDIEVTVSDGTYSASSPIKIVVIESIPEENCEGEYELCDNFNDDSIDDWTKKVGTWDVIDNHLTPTCGFCSPRLSKPMNLNTNYFEVGFYANLNKLDCRGATVRFKNQSGNETLSYGADYCKAWNGHNDLLLVVNNNRYKTDLNGDKDWHYYKLVFRDGNYKAYYDDTIVLDIDTNDTQFETSEILLGGWLHSQPGPTYDNLILKVLNYAPFIDDIDDTQVDEGKKVSFHILALDPEGSRVKLNSSETLPQGAELDCSILHYDPVTQGTYCEFSWTPNFDQAGVYPITFIAEDGKGGSDEKVATITVNNINRPPEITAISNIELNESQGGTLISFQVSDKDGDKVNLSYENLPNWITQNKIGENSYALYFTPGYDDAGKYNITFIAEDENKAKTYEYMIVTVNDVCVADWQVNYTEWSDCQADLKTRIKYYYDTNNCAEENPHANETEIIFYDCCTPDIVAHNTSCSPSDEIIEYYTDNNNCYSQTQLVSDSLPENNTYECDYCSPNWIEHQTKCSIRDNYTLYLLDENNCHAQTQLESDLEGFMDNLTISCDHCIPDFVAHNTSCLVSDEIIEFYTDNNNCYETTNLESDQLPENNTYKCDFCTPLLTNTSWSEWINDTECSVNDNQMQSRTRTQYDENTCKEVDNVTFTDYQTVTCDFCTPQLTNTSWSEWSNNTECQPDDTQEQVRALTQYDKNTCDEVNNVTFTDYQTISCDYCTPNWILNETWTECELGDIQYTNWYDTNNCEEEPMEQVLLFQEQADKAHPLNGFLYVNYTKKKGYDAKWQLKYQNRSDNVIFENISINTNSDCYNHDEDHLILRVGVCAAFRIQPQCLTKTGWKNLGAGTKGTSCGGTGYSSPTKMYDNDYNTGCTYGGNRWMCLNPSAMVFYEEAIWWHTEIPIFTQINQTCDYCTPQLTNTTWSEWSNNTECQPNDTQQQVRTLTQYDEKTCNEIQNTTFEDYQTVTCDFCIPNWEVNYTEWTDCQPDDTKSRIRYYYDSNNCEEPNPHNNITQKQACDYCTPHWVLNETWTECEPTDIQFKNYYDTKGCGEEFTELVESNNEKSIIEVGQWSHYERAFDSDLSTYSNLDGSTGWPRSGHIYVNYSYLPQFEDGVILQHKVIGSWGNVELKFNCFSYDTNSFTTFKEFTSSVNSLTDIKIPQECISYNSDLAIDIYGRSFVTGRNLYLYEIQIKYNSTSVINQTCDYCTPLLTNTSWTEWSNHTECQPDDTQQQIRTLIQYDEKTCNEIDNTTFTDYQTISCNFCTPDWLPDYTDWGECVNDLETRTKFYFDAKICDEENPYENETQTQECDSCTPLLTNTSWSEWSNHTECQSDNTKEQVKSLTQYDEYNCNEIDNLTFTDYQTIPCDYCTPNWEFDYTEWSECIDDLKTRTKYYYDIYNCAEENPHANETQSRTCDSCTPLLSNTSWSEWSDHTECLNNDTQLQIRTLTQYDEHNCDEVDDIIFTDYKALSCDYCAPEWVEEKTGCMENNLINGWYNDINNCFELTDLEDDNNPPENNTYPCDYQNLHRPKIDSIDYEIEYTETDEIIITVQGSDPDKDQLEYSIDDSRFEQNDNVFTWQTDSGDFGTHKFRITVSDNQFSDTERIKITVNPLPDLEVSNFEPARKIGTNMFVKFIISNKGNKKAENVNWIIDTGPEGNNPVNKEPLTVEVGQDTIVYTLVKFTESGTYPVTVTADYDNLIQEINEDNNQQTGSVTV